MSRYASFRPYALVFTTNTPLLARTAKQIDLELEQVYAFTSEAFSEHHKAVYERYAAIILALQR
jgi:hypothetical protein